MYKVNNVPANHFVVLKFLNHVVDFFQLAGLDDWVNLAFSTELETFSQVLTSTNQRTSNNDPIQNRLGNVQLHVTLWQSNGNQLAIWTQGTNSLVKGSWRNSRNNSCMNAANLFLDLFVNIAVMTVDQNFSAFLLGSFQFVRVTINGNNVSTKYVVGKLNPQVTQTTSTND